MVLTKASFEKIFIAVYLFSLTCLNSVEHLYTYYAIMICEFIIAALIALHHCRYGRIFFSGYFFWLIGVFIIYMLTPVLNASYLEFSYLYFASHLINTLSIVFMFFDMQTERIIDVWCNGSSIGSVLSILFVAINEADAIRLGSIRIGESASGNVNVLGMYLGIMSIFVLYKVVVLRQKKYLAVYILQLIFILLTGSKQSLIYVAVSGLAFCMYSYRHDFKKYLISFILAVCLVIAIFKIPTLYELIGYRIEITLVSFGLHIDGLSSSYSTDQRMKMILKAVEMFKHHPIFGGGWGYFIVKSGFNVYSHTTYTELLVTYGLFGFLVYYSLYYKTLFRYIKSDRNNSNILFLVLLVSILIADIARITFSQTPLNYVILFLAWKAIRSSGVQMQNGQFKES